VAPEPARFGHPRRQVALLRSEPGAGPAAFSAPESGTLKALALGSSTAAACGVRNTPIALLSRPFREADSAGFPSLARGASHLFSQHCGATRHPMVLPEQKDERAKSRELSEALTSTGRAGIRGDPLYGVGPNRLARGRGPHGTSRCPNGLLRVQIRIFDPSRCSSSCDSRLRSPPAHSG
jgi:hypothetical protein